MSDYIIDYDLNIGFETATNSGIEWLKVDFNFPVVKMTKKHLYVCEAMMSGLVEAKRRLKTIIDVLLNYDFIQIFLNLS